MLSDLLKVAGLVGRRVEITPRQSKKLTKLGAASVADVQNLSAASTLTQLAVGVLIVGEGIATLHQRKTNKTLKGQVGAIADAVFADGGEVVEETTNSQSVKTAPTEPEEEDEA